jgi:hypothetical protein
MSTRKALIVVKKEYEAMKRMTLKKMEEVWVTFEE